MSRLSFFSIFLFFFIGCTSNRPLTSEDLKFLEKIDSRKFIFHADMALPTGYRSIPLTSEYTLTICGDTVTAYLPYFGRAYVAPINTTEGGIKFVSTINSYNSLETKTGREIMIEPKDVSTGTKMILRVSASGNAQLSVSDPNRQQISFNGTVE